MLLQRTKNRPYGHRFVERIDDAVDTLQRVGDFVVIAKLHTWEKVHRQTLQHNAGRLRKTRLQWHCRRSWRWR